MNDITTVKELIAILEQCDPNAQCFVWLPGSRISMHGLVAGTPHGVLIEGNVMPGSALDDLCR